MPTTSFFFCHSLSLFLNSTLRVGVWIIFIESNQVYKVILLSHSSHLSLSVSYMWPALSLSAQSDHLHQWKTFCWVASVLGRRHHAVIILIESDKKQKLNNLGFGVSIFCLESYIFGLMSCSVLLGKARVGLVSHALFYSFFTFYLENIKLIQKKFLWWIDVFQLGSFSTY